MQLPSSVKCYVFSMHVLSYDVRISLITIKTDEVYKY